MTKEEHMTLAETEAAVLKLASYRLCFGDYTLTEAQLLALVAFAHGAGERNGAKIACQRFSGILTSTDSSGVTK